MKIISDKEIGQIEWGSATLDMGFVDDYPEEVKALLDAQLEADQKEHDAIVREIFEEIEKEMFDIADSRSGITGILKLREGTFRKAYTEWQAFKKKFVK